MKPVDHQTLLTQLKWRYATEKFDSARKIPLEDWNALEQSLILTASSYGLQPWHFVVVTSQAVKDSLVPAAYGQQQLSQASHVVVLAMKKSVDAEHVEKHVRQTATVRDLPIEKLSTFRDHMLGTIKKLGPDGTDIWSSRQVYIALGTLLTCAAMLGIDASPMEGIKPAQFDQILGLDQRGFTTLAIAALGYRAADDSAARDKKVRFHARDVITHVS